MTVFVYAMVMTTAYTLLIAYFGIFQNFKNFNEKAQKIEENFISENKQFIKGQVERIGVRLKSDMRMLDRNIRTDLYHKVDTAGAFLTDLKKNLDNRIKGEDVGSIILCSLENFRWKYKNGYFFVFDKKGTVLYHGGRPEDKGKNVKELAEFNPMLSIFLNDAMKNGEATGYYPYFKPDKPDVQKQKLGYVKYFDKLGFYIVGSVYIDEAVRKVEHGVLNALEKLRYGKGGYGYYWAQKRDVVVMHPVNPEIVGKNMRNITSPDGVKVGEVIDKLAQEKGGGFLEYTWINPSIMKNDKKISYVKYIPSLDLIIGTGFYRENLRASIDNEKNSLFDLTKKNALKISLLLIFFYLVTTVGSLSLYRYLKALNKKQDEAFIALDQYKQVLDESSIVSRADLSGKITYVNDKFTEVSGYSKEEAVGANHNIIRHPSTPISVFRELWKTISDGKVWKGMIKNRRKDGEAYYMNATILPLKNELDEIIEYISASQNITELVENKSKMKSFSMTDILTGLGNKVKLLNDISQFQAPCLALIDIVNFKNINDLYGEAEGDRVLKGFGKSLIDYTNDTKYSVYRFHGDIFAVLGYGTCRETFPDDVKVLLKNILSVKYDVREESISCMTRAGISMERRNIVTCADAALKYAKKVGHNISIFDHERSEFKNMLGNKIEIIEQLNDALRENRVIGHYQPVYDLKQEKINKYECLMRVQKKDGTFLMPMEFLSIAKQSMIYTKLTLKIIDHAIHEFHNREDKVSINLSFEDLISHEVIDYLIQQVMEYGMSDRLIVEIVETEELTDYDEVEKTLMKLKETGLEIAIDDFGVGYSNYNYLNKIQADYLKIDGSITSLLLNNEKTRKLLESIVNFAKESDMQVIAEFVDSIEVADELKRIGVDYAQGYYFGKPEPLD